MDTAELGAKTEEHNCYSEVELNGNNSFDNCSITSNEISYNSSFKPMKRRKRYFKGLSYSFNNKRHPKKRRMFGERGRANYSMYDSSEQDTDSQSTVITSGELHESSGTFKSFNTPFRLLDLREFFIRSHTYSHTRRIKSQIISGAQLISLEHAFAVITFQKSPRN